MESDLFLSFGSNVGDRLNYIVGAFKRLLEIGLSLSEVSSLYSTRPYGNTEQEEFLNCVGKFRHSGDPELFLRELKSVERAVGRVERFRWGPREIDIDILLFGDTILTTKELKIPHNDIIKRKFVLVPLLEIESEIRDPRDGVLFSDHLKRLGRDDWPRIFIKANSFRRLIEREVKK
ncbi:MAG TPA: 2-amino-4-hydroxy-6-hydroxymethyldihydropteridine diphosphokinase [Mesotoga infera]|uniref:2-amino-4-hydroxy-6-hydroxymethyldihydropteridine diphosphokinase n=1 Tax=Mesotoga infera TaxID=1236046 RepID=A0A7C1GRC4_9BACT|nr:2-amino-4-hydroxy-6-hydroxymethyldihydropteridine diphosphokinase [Mesotoga infera]